MKTFAVMLNFGDNNLVALGTFQSPCLPRVDEKLTLNDMQGAPAVFGVVQVSHSAYIESVGLDPEAMYAPLVTVVPENAKTAQMFVARISR